MCTLLLVIILLVNLIIYKRLLFKYRGLDKEEDGELPDPYVKMYLLPDRSKDSKRKTDVIKDSCNPVYDERIEYSISTNELTQRTLEVSVVNKKGFFHLQKSSTMGQVCRTMQLFIRFLRFS